MYACVYSSIRNMMRYMGNVSGDEANNNNVVAKDPSSGNRRNDEGFEARQMTRDRIKVPICPKCYVYGNMSKGGLKALRSPKARPKGRALGRPKARQMPRNRIYVQICWCIMRGKV